MESAALTSKMMAALFAVVVPSSAVAYGFSFHDGHDDGGLTGDVHDPRVSHRNGALRILARWPVWCQALYWWAGMLL